MPIDDPFYGAPRLGFGPYRARIERVIDGDTLDLLVDLGGHSFREVRVRVLGVDTPETHRGTERAAGAAAKAFTETLCRPAVS